jgi:hypothetical protein
LGGVLGIKCVSIFNDEVRVEQFVRVFVRIGGGRLGARVRALLGARKAKSPDRITCWSRATMAHSMALTGGSCCATAQTATSPEMRSPACRCNRRALRECPW